MTINNDARIKKDTVEEFLTCPLCSKLLTEATTVCSCLHTFCKDCIYQKLEEDELNRCPLCNDFLGIFPKEKLRPDSYLQDIRMKIFPPKESKALERKRIHKSVNRKKKKSLSSLDNPATHTVTKHSSHRAESGAQKSEMFQEDRSKIWNDRNTIGSNNRSSYSHKRSKKLPKFSDKQVSGEESFRASGINIGPHKHLEPPPILKEGSNDWERLTLLAETANRAVNSDTTLSGLPAFNTETSNNKNVKNTRMKRRAREFKSSQSNINVNIESNSAQQEQEQAEPSSCSPKFDGSRKQSIEDSKANDFCDNAPERPQPVWFALLACRDEKRRAYPQIPKCYIKIKDRKMPVSYINKYLMQKLNLRHESEVEIVCCGHMLIPEAKLSDVVDIWRSNVDSSTESNFSSKSSMMVLSYRRK